MHSQHTCLHIQRVEVSSVGGHSSGDGADPVHRLALQDYAGGSRTVVVAICVCLSTAGRALVTLAAPLSPGLLLLPRLPLYAVWGRSSLLPRLLLVLPVSSTRSLALPELRITTGTRGRPVPWATLLLLCAGSSACPRLRAFWVLFTSDVFEAFVHLFCPVLLLPSLDALLATRALVRSSSQQASGSAG